MQKYLAVLIVIVCTVLLQAHSIPFWMDQTGNIIGILWSITIEFAAIWLWINKKILLATIASFIIILVPLAELSKPLLSEIRLVAINTQISKLNDLDLKQSELLQDKYSKANWTINLKKNAEDFRAAINTQKELLTESSKLKSTYENIFIILLQSVALIVVLLTQIQALKMLSFQNFRKDETVEISETQDFSNSETLQTSENRAEILLSKIDIYKENSGVTQFQMSEKLDVPSSTISKLRNKVLGNGEAISANKFTELEAKFEKLAS